jgi:hypothetical protein
MCHTAQTRLCLFRARATTAPYRPWLGPRATCRARCVRARCARVALVIWPHSPVVLAAQELLQPLQAEVGVSPSGAMFAIKGADLCKVVNNHKHNNYKLLVLNENNETSRQRQHRLAQLFVETQGVYIVAGKLEGRKHPGHFFAINAERGCVALVLVLVSRLANTTQRLRRSVSSAQLHRRFVNLGDISGAGRPVTLKIEQADRAAAGVVSAVATKTVLGRLEEALRSLYDDTLGVELYWAAQLFVSQKWAHKTPYA